MRTARSVAIATTAIAAIDWLSPGHAQTSAPVPAAQTVPFTMTLSNTAPLAFGMDPRDVAAALGTPLTYLRGGPGNEIFLAFRTVGGSEIFNRSDRLFLQFRNGRLAGWKGDWGRRWIWQ